MTDISTSIKSLRFDETNANDSREASGSSSLIQPPSTPSPDARVSRQRTAGLSYTEAPTSHKAVSESLAVMSESLSPSEDNSALREERLIDDDIVLHEVERRVFFTDAVVAIAMTLLILPLMENASEDVPEDEEDESALSWYQDNKSRLFAFVLTFHIVFLFWKGHASLYRMVRCMTDRLDKLNFYWMLTIVYTPVVTALVGRNEIKVTSKTNDGLAYVFVVLVSRLLSAGMMMEVRRHPVMWATEKVPEDLIRDRLQMKSLVAIIDLLIICISMGTSVTPVGIYPLFGLLLTQFICRLLIRRWPDLLALRAEDDKPTKASMGIFEQIRGHLHRK